MKRIFRKSIMLTLAVACTALYCASCSQKDEPQPLLEAKLTKFVLTNTGAAANEAVEATIDEATKAVTAKVAYETNITKLKFTAEATPRASILPASGSEKDFSSAVTIIVKNGDVTQTYVVTVTKLDPKEVILDKVGFVNATGMKYLATINYDKKEVEVNVLQGYGTLVKLDGEITKALPQAATIVFSGVDNNGFVDIANNDITITVTLGEDKAEYKVIAKIVAVGADFTNVKAGLFTANKGAVPLELADNNSRDAHMGNGIVYVPSRTNGNHVYYWEADKVFTNNAQPSELSTQGMDFAGVTWTVSSVYTVGEKIYVASMANAVDKILKVWYYANKDAAPQEILSYTITTPIAPSTKVRLGDCFSVITDATGKGKMFFSNFPYDNLNNQFYVFDVNSYTEVNVTPKVINLMLETGFVGQYGRVNAVPGEPNKYIVTGAEMGTAIIDAEGNIEHVIPTDVIQGRAQDVSIVEYNQARYLIYTVNREWDASGEGAFGEVINISGGNVVDALKKLTKSTDITDNRVNRIVLSTTTYDAWVSACASASVVNNELYIMNFTTLNGFAIQKFGAAK